MIAEIEVLAQQQPVVAIALLASCSATQKIVLTGAAAAEIFAVVTARVKGLEPIAHQIRSALPGSDAAAKPPAAPGLVWTLCREQRAGPGGRPDGAGSAACC